MSAEPNVLAFGEDLVTLAYDFTLKRPGCALIQATYGASIPAFDLQRMSDSWLLFPTDDMKFVAVTKEQVDQLVTITNGARA